MVISIFPFVLVFYHFALVSSQFPTECFNITNFNDKICCPTPPGAELACGEDLGIGKCSFIEPSDEGDYQPHNSFISLDERTRWPSHFLKYGCDCEFPFAGTDCGECEFGYYGVECQEKKMLVRRNMLDPDYPELFPKLREYMTWAKGNISDKSTLNTSPVNFTRNAEGLVIPEFTTPSAYDYFTWFHNYGSMLEFVNSTFTFAFIEFNHLGPATFPWHKRFVLMFERMLQKLSGDHDFVIPYWNWMAPEDGQCDICNDKYFGASMDNSGTLSPDAFMADWSTVCMCNASKGNYEHCDASVICDEKVQRKPTKEVGYPSLPDRDDWGFALKLAVYDNPPYNQYANCSFRNIYSGGGDSLTGLGSGDITYSPIFSLHGRVHWYLGGTMADIPRSVNDPIFWVHHTNVDRLFEQWLRIQGVTVDWYPAHGTSVGQSRDSYLIPYFPVVKVGEMFTTIAQFGYRYDNLDENGYSSDLQWYATDRYGTCEDYVKWKEWPFTGNEYQGTVV